jgi:hypothetical protein
LRSHPQMFRAGVRPPPSEKRRALASEKRRALAVLTVA